MSILNFLKIKVKPSIKWLGLIENCKTLGDIMKLMASVRTPEECEAFIEAYHRHTGDFSTEIFVKPSERGCWNAIGWNLGFHKNDLKVWSLSSIASSPEFIKGYADGVRHRDLEDEMLKESIRV